MERIWYKGEGSSCCRDYVNGYICDECYCSLNHPNELKMHMQTHFPRDITCPLCDEREFKSMANVLQHIESGCCSGTSGIENASQEIMIMPMTCLVYNM
jgi:Zinc finger, C2H2 type